MDKEINKHNKKDVRGVLGEIPGRELNLTKEGLESYTSKNEKYININNVQGLTTYHDTKKDHGVPDENSESRFNNALQKISKVWNKGERKIKQSIDEQRKDFRKQLKDVRDRKELHETTQGRVNRAESKQTFNLGDDYIYEKITQSYLEPTTGTHTMEITIQLKKADGTLVEEPSNIKYSGEAAAIARLCSSKMDAYIQNNSHDVLAQAKRKIEEKLKENFKLEITKEREQVIIQDIPEESKKAIEQDILKNKDNYELEVRNGLKQGFIQAITSQREQTIRQDILKNKDNYELEVRNGLKQGFIQAITSQREQAIRQAITSQREQAIRQAIPEERKETIRQNIINDLEQNFREEAENEIKQQIGREIIKNMIQRRQEITKELQEKIEAKVKSRIKDKEKIIEAKVKEMINKELEERIDEEVQESMSEVEVQNNINTKVQESMSKAKEEIGKEAEESMGKEKVQNDINTEVQKTINKNVQESMGKAKEEIDEKVQESMNGVTIEEIYTKVQKMALEAEVQKVIIKEAEEKFSALKQEIKEKIIKERKPEIEREIKERKPEIEREIKERKPEIEREIKENMFPEYQTLTESEQKQKLTEEVQERIEKQVKERINKEVQARIDKEVQARIDKETREEFIKIESKKDNIDKELRKEIDKEVQKIKKADAYIKKFLDKYGNRYMNSELLEELQWVEGMEAASRDINGRILGSENNLYSSPEELGRITTEINDKIEEIKNLLPTSPAAHAESDAPAGSNNTSSSETSHLSHAPLTLQNFEQQTKDYINNHTHRGLSDNIYKEIRSLATDESTYPESLGAQDKKKIRKTLLYVGQMLAERQYKLDEPLEMIEKWERYKASHYGRRLMNERQLIDHYDKLAKISGEHAAALYHEIDLMKEVNQYYKASVKLAKVFPTSKINFDEYEKQINTNTEKLEEIRKQIEKNTPDQNNQNEQVQQNKDELHKQAREYINNSLEYINDSFYLLQEVQKNLQEPNRSLQKTLEELQKAEKETRAKHQELEEAKVVKEKIQELVKLEKGRDDANDNLDLAKVNNIKETDKETLKDLRTWEQNLVKQFYHIQNEDHKALNKEEEEIRQFLITLERMDIGNTIQQKRMALMYWLSFFGSGDQAALFSLGRESTAEFSAFMGLFR